MTKLALFATAAAAAVMAHPAAAQVVVHHTPGTTTHGSAFFHAGMFPHRLQPGFIVPPMWFGPQFHVTNWQMYGFAPPPPRHRWVRYHDDAYLIDDGGRIRDTRYGMDWDRYGERWDMEDGIPHYYGRGDFRPGPEDYAWVERFRGDHGGEDYADYEDEDYGPGHGPAYGHGYGPPGPPPGCHPGPQPCGGFMPAGYGYGYGVIAYPIVIETTVVSGGCGCVEEVVEEAVEYRHQRARHRPRPRRPAPPPPGERG
jgi:Ni/Co efflux regulator RcnB